MRNRKALAVTAVLCAGALTFTGCSGKTSSKGPSAQTQTDDISKLVQINPQNRDALDQGGSFRFSVGKLGPNFNTWSNAGNSDDTISALAPIDTTGCFNSKADGTPVVNTDYCTSVTEKLENGKQTITYKLNPNAKFNDGTPMDAAMFINMWHMLDGENQDVSLVQTKPYDSIENVQQGATPQDVIVTMKQVYEPYTDLYSGFLSPQVKDAETFNKGFVSKIHDEWRAGPFKVGEFDDAKQTLTLVPNEKWWGQKPMLDKIVITAMATSATIPAFKNGELDITGAGTASRYQQLAGAKDMEFRRGQRHAAFGLEFNTKQPELADVALRKAIYQITDRKQLVDVRFQGLNWEEKAPGSWMLMTISPYYQDNYPVKGSDVAGGQQTLKDAGYTLNATTKKFEKDGKPVQVTISNFGDDPTAAALVQAMQKQWTDAGIDTKIDQRPDSAFNDAMDKQDFFIAFMGYGIGPDASASPSQYFKSKGDSNMTSCGDPTLDDRIDKVTTITDAKARNKEAMDIEKAWQEKCYAMLPLFNGPSISAVNKYLANYGPSMFLSTDWSNIGWMKGHKKD